MRVIQVIKHSLATSTHRLRMTVFSSARKDDGPALATLPFVSYARHPEVAGRA